MKTNLRTLKFEIILFFLTHHSGELYPEHIWILCSAHVLHIDFLLYFTFFYSGIPEYTETVGTSDEYVAECSIMCLGFPMQ